MVLLVDSPVLAGRKLENQRQVTPALRQADCGAAFHFADVPGRRGLHMKLSDLSAKELIELDAEQGAIRFAGQRALFVDAMAMGLLRKDLVDHLGLSVARAVLTRFGFAHGWRMAEAMESQFNWESPSEWRNAGPRIQMMEGMFRMEKDSDGAVLTGGLTLTSSFEAEQHIAHLGRSPESTCWMICGMASGYQSRASGKEMYVLEERCAGKGDAACHLLARTREEWGDERADELRFFHVRDLGSWLDSSIHEIAEELKKVENKLHATKRALAQVEGEQDPPLGMVARSPAMRRVLDLAMRVAKVDTTVLITGESGTGKERLARLVHDESSRALGPFIAIDCGAITETLLESELFGHVRGAFTGAVQDRAGLFEAANGGTLLLDELGEVPLGIQVKLLRALQEREVRRVGENRNRPIDVRVLAATNREPSVDLASGRLRKDLYYRLNVVELRVPPLRERREDVLAMARILLAEASVRLKRPVSGFTPRAADQILRYSWPGNVRELKNAMEHAVALAQSTVTDTLDLPEEVREAPPGAPVSGVVRPLDEVEKDHILDAMSKNNGNQTKTALQLGIGSATLYRKLKKYGEESAAAARCASGATGN
jgi:DNA-binding NtrC family response regulator/predicted hydrocarbon binding protein